MIYNEPIIRTARHKELHEGVSGNGSTLYMVVTVRDSDGSWMHVEYFKSESEAKCWFEYA
jgi:hypothetical protein